MGIGEILLIGVGLSMDAAAVSISNGLCYRQASKARLLAMPLMFGVFQALMPLIGYYVGNLFYDFISQYDNILVFLILVFIGGKMIYEVIRHRGEEVEKKPLTIKLVIAQAIATSIDALAVGIGFSAMQVNIVSTVALIGVTTFFISLIALIVGCKFSGFLGDKAEILGGVILIAIGIKSLF